MRTVQGDGGGWRCMVSVFSTGGSILYSVVLVPSFPHFTPVNVVVTISPAPLVRVAVCTVP